MILRYLSQLNDPTQYTIVLASQSPRRLQLLHQMGLRNVRVLVSKFEENLCHSSFPTPAEYSVATATGKMRAILAKPDLLDALQVSPLHTDSSIGSINRADNNLSLGKYVIIIAADSVVAQTNPKDKSVRIFEKAKDATAAAEYITSLVQNQDSPCEVVTGMVIAVVPSTPPSVPAPSTVSSIMTLPSYLTQSVQEMRVEASPRCHVEVLDPATFQLPSHGGDTTRGIHGVYRTWDITTVHMNPHLTTEDIQEYIRHTSAWEGKAGGFGIQDLAATFITGIRGDYYNVMGLPIQRLGAVMAHIIEGSSIPTTTSTTSSE